MLFIKICCALVVFFMALAMAICMIYGVGGSALILGIIASTAISTCAGMGIALIMYEEL